MMYKLFFQLILMLTFCTMLSKNSAAAVDSCALHNNDEVNKGASDLAELFVSDGATLLVGKLELNKLDFTIGSLKFVDDAMVSIHTALPTKNEAKDIFVLNQRQLNELVLRTGVYLGEVIRRNSDCRFSWVEFKSLSDDLKKLLGGSPDLGSIIILSDKNSNSSNFPLNNSIKILLNGSEDAAEFFAKVAISK